MSKTTTIGCLPNECILDIVKYLGYKAAINFGLANMRINAIVKYFLSNDRDLTLNFHLIEHLNANIIKYYSDVLTHFTFNVIQYVEDGSFSAERHNRVLSVALSRVCRFYSELISALNDQQNLQTRSIHLHFRILCDYPLNCFLRTYSFRFEDSCTDLFFHLQNFNMSIRCLSDIFDKRFDIYIYLRR